MNDHTARFLQPERRSRQILFRILPWAVLALSLGATADMWRNDMRYADQVLRNDFDVRVRGALERIEERVAAYEQILDGLGGLFAASPDISRKEFNNYVGALKLPLRQPGIRGIGFVKLLHEQEQAAYVARMRQQGMRDFGIFPDSGNAVHAVMAFHTPGAVPCLPPAGYDLNADPRHRSALAMAASLNIVATTGKIDLARECGEAGGPALIMYAPVHTEQLGHERMETAGWVSISVLLSDFVGQLSQPDRTELDVEIFNDDDVTGAPLFDLDNRPMHAEPERGRYRATHQLRVASQTWTVAVRSLPAFEARLDRSANIKAGFGIAASLLLAILTWLLAGSRERAVNAARAMNQALFEREKRYRQMFEEGAAKAVLVDPSNGRIVDANPAAAAFWGYPVAQLRRMHIGDIDLSRDGAILGRMREITNGPAARFESRHRLADGSARDVVLYAGNLTYEKRVLVHAIVHDITERKQAELALRASEERYRLIAENTDDVIWLMDVETLRFTYVSPSIVRQRGYTPEELIALHDGVQERPPKQGIGPHSMQLGCRLQERLRRFNAGDESQRWQVKEIDQRHKDGRIVPVEVTTTLLCDEENRPRALVGVSRDIKVRREAQEEQKRFMAMVSHEFRTPLATIDGAVQRLLSTATHADDMTRRRYDKIEKAVDRLTGLLDDYLTQERFDTVGQGMHLSEASLSTLLRDCAASAYAVAADHVITVEDEGLPAIFLCDVDRLRLALRILADNAAKYTPPGSTIVLFGRIVENAVEIGVSDDGEGIPPNELPHIFDRFFRGSRAATQAGSGLGLHMARSVIEKHGGTLVAANRPEGGALFVARLPWREQQALVA